MYNPVTKKILYVRLYRHGTRWCRCAKTCNTAATALPECLLEKARPAGPFNDKITFCKAGWHDDGTPISKQNPPANFTGNMYTGNNPQHLGGFDPGVLVDVVEKDSKGNPTKVRTYLFWGFTWPYAVELEEDMVTLKPGTMKAATL